ncbi:MAG TPA: DUF6265 family protein [Vicinamibacterales bacterium]|nr:DUF6265 family protein [Vicinamibacterales bacterium]
MSNVLLLAATIATQGATNAVTDLDWLSGCWQYSAGSRTVTEFWLPPDGGTMMGLSRTVSGGKTVEHEFLLLRVGPHGIEYVAKPSGQAEAVFTASKVASGEVVFENPAHDFPTRITYRKTDGGLVATIDGMVKGKPRAIDFRYSAATTCTR